MCNYYQPTSNKVQRQPASHQKSGSQMINPWPFCFSQRGLNNPLLHDATISQKRCKAFLQHTSPPTARKGNVRLKSGTNTHITSRPQKNQACLSTGNAKKRESQADFEFWFILIEPSLLPSPEWGDFYLRELLVNNPSSLP